MYGRILVPLKSDPGDAALLRHATALARLAGGTVILMHAIHSHTRDAAAYLERESSSYLAGRAHALRALDIPTETVVSLGEPSTAICSVARDTRADLVVMGSHGHSQARHVLMGSVTEDVVRRCTTPVLLVRPEEEVSGT